MEGDRQTSWLVVIMTLTAFYQLSARFHVYLVILCVRACSLIYFIYLFIYYLFKVGSMPNMGSELRTLRSWRVPCSSDGASQAPHRAPSRNVTGILICAVRCLGWQTCVFCHRKGVFPTAN